MSDINRVELTGQVAATPDFRVVPPGDLYVSFELTLRGEWPDYTGQTVLLEYRIPCFAQGQFAERLLWVRSGQRVRVLGGIDLVAGEWDERRMAMPYHTAVRVREAMLEEAFQQLREAENDER